MRFLGLTRGFWAMVDDEDYERLLVYKWHAAPSKWRVYAGRVRRVSEGAGPERVLLHYEVLGLMNPLKDGRVIDHIDRNGLNCCKDNLRLCTNSENAANRGPNKQQKSSKYKGVFYLRERRYYKAGWVASIRCKGKRHYLGFFNDEYTAVKAYNVAAYRKFGEFAYLNIWDGPSTGRKVTDSEAKPLGPMVVRERESRLLPTFMKSLR